MAHSKSKMSVEKAFSIIDSHLTPPSPVKLEEVSPSRRIYRNGREFPPNPTLPAFHVEYRDGPSPFDTHRGQYVRRADALWENTVNFNLVVNGEKYPPERLGPWKGHTLLDVVGTGEVEANVKSNCFLGVALPEEVHLNAIGTAEKMTAKYNPLKDRQRVQREVEAGNTTTFLKRLRSSKVGYDKSCLQNYPHGALGLEESPYGDPGEIYGKQQRRLEEARRKAEHTMKGQAEIPEDHMRGPIRIFEDEPVKRRERIDPPCNLFGGSIVRVPENDLLDNTTRREGITRIRSLNVPPDHLLGGFFLDNAVP